MHVFTQRTGNKRAKHRTQVDAHVKNIKGGIFVRVIVIVKITYNGRNIGFKKAVANDNNPQTEVEQKQPGSRIE